MARRNRNSVQSVDKVFAILETLANNDGRLKLTQLSGILKMPTSTVHRFLSSLLALGYVNQDPATGEYLLGVRFLFLAGVVENQLDLRKIAYPILEVLRDETGETANVVVLNSGEALYVEKVESKASVRVFSLIGRRAPVHATGAGKVLLSDWPWEDAAALLAKKGMAKITEHTITDLDRFGEELDKVRSSGYALDWEECETGVRCVAAPVKNHVGKIVASLSLSGPVNRVTEKRIPGLIKAVVSQAHQLSLLMGYKASVA